MIIAFMLLSLLIGFLFGWLGCEKYTALLNFEPHEYEKLFKENPHPEIYDKTGKVDRDEYTVISFGLGYDPEEFDPEHISYGDDED